jgi:hypothetical protein
VLLSPSSPPPPLLLHMCIHNVHTHINTFLCGYLCVCKYVRHLYMVMVVNEILLLHQLQLPYYCDVNDNYSVLFILPLPLLLTRSPIHHHYPFFPLVLVRSLFFFAHFFIVLYNFLSLIFFSKFILSDIYIDVSVYYCCIHYIHIRLID